MNKFCSLCPNGCKIDKSTAKGLCGTDNSIVIAKYYLHPFEEPVISGTKGSGTVFFSGCALKCVFCQNYELSRSMRGKVFSPAQLADVFKQLEDMGAHNIKFAPYIGALFASSILGSLISTTGVFRAATADLSDVNMIDPFHLEAYGVTTVNYNRDVEAFPVLITMFERILGECPYKSPTDMGVNMVGNCIVDDGAAREASRQEILRRYYTLLCDQKQGKASDSAVYKMELLMKKAGVSKDDRRVVGPALARAEETGLPAAAMELPDGRIITGKTSGLLGASSALLLNALKLLGGIPDELHLIAPVVINPIQRLKVEHLGNRNPRLHTDEVLIALSISATTNPAAELALAQLGKLRGCDVHSSVILSAVDEKVFKRLGVNLTCQPQFKG